jgi:hypothetical protein
MCVCACVCVRACTRGCACGCVGVCMGVWVRVRVWVCMCARVCGGVRVGACPRVGVHVCVCACACAWGGCDGALVMSPGYCTGADRALLTPTLRNCKVPHSEPTPGHPPDFGPQVQRMALLPSQGHDLWLPR